MSFNDIINKQTLEFEDRDFFFEEIKNYYQQMQYKKPFFKVVSISGMGGIGKTRLINELISVIKKTYSNDPDQIILHITLEISGSDFFYALTKLRGEIKEVCPLFDYAFLNYWKQTQISKLDSSFMSVFQNQWIEAINMTGSMFSIPIKSASISLDIILQIVEKVFTCVKEKYYANFFQKRSKKISDYSVDELKECLAGFLGMDINRIFCEKNLCVFIDSYQRYPSSNYVDWLMDLIEQANTGLFIVSGRETIAFPDKLGVHSKSYPLNALPMVNAEQLLKRYLPDLSNLEINRILKVTECLPIYLDLAISTYKNIHINKSMVDKNHFFMYQTKEELIKAFFNHLTPSHQQFFLTLSFLQIFDLELYSYIISLCPYSSVTDYEDFKSFSIISKIENDNDFFKVHDVLNTNVIAILDEDIRKILFHKYLEHIVSKTIFFITDTQKIILYKHILNMVINNNFILQQADEELILDFFFSLKQTLHILLPSGIYEMEAYEPLKEINYFTKAVSNERENTLTRLEYLKNIDFEKNNLGKHQRSLKIIYGFLTQWTGTQKPLVEYLSNAYPLLDDTEIREWYYAQTVIFWADHLTITGKFKTAKKILFEFQNKIQKFPEQENSIFQAARHIGHLFRFNMFLKDANRIYFSLMNELGQFKNSFQEIYILTNICETNCYLNPEKVLQYGFKGLKLGKKLKDLKSQAKIYYSMAIVAIHRKKYKCAKKYIRKSMYLDTLDGYELGILSSMLANIYLQFSRKEHINSKSFEKLLSKVNVYGFFELPLALIKQDSKKVKAIGKKYEWLNFDITLKVFIKFLATIQ